jgi:hypothetical protein
MIVNLAAIALGLFIGWTAAHVSKELKHSSSMVAAYRAGMEQRQNQIAHAKQSHPSSGSEPTNVYKLRRK